MSKIALSGNASGTGTFTLASPNSSTNRTLDLPDASGVVVLDTATQTLTNKTIQGGAITSGTSQASTSGTAIDFTGIPSWVKRIVVMFQGVSTNGTSNWIIQLGDAGGIETTGYLGAGAFTGTSTGGANYTAGFGINSANAANVAHGSVIISKFASGNEWIASGNIALSSGAFVFSIGGSKSLSDTLTQVRITTVNGTDTFDAGSINILYE